MLRKQERKQVRVLKQVQRVLQRESTRAARSERREAGRCWKSLRRMHFFTAVCLCARLPRTATGLTAMARFRPRKDELQRMKSAQPRAFVIRHRGGDRRVERGGRLKTNTVS